MVGSSRRTILRLSPVAAANSVLRFVTSRAPGFAIERHRKIPHSSINFAGVDGKAQRALDKSVERNARTLVASRMQRSRHA